MGTNARNRQTALEPGARIGHYEIAEPIGAGGMGEVYRATDTTLGREVAIKVLPQSLAADPDRIERLEREAKTLAALNAPNVAQIYGLERRDDTTALAIELVEGPTLADRIAEGAFPPDEALHVAMQIADALEAAHAQGIVHRDLKPANIKLRPDGIVKVLDFGIAKAFEPQAAASGAQSPVVATPAVTEAGIILGTAAYMSPEQARGRPVDERTDLWAFGCVLYEMLTGQPAFGGADVTTTLARVLEREPDLGALPSAVSPEVHQALRLCLRKDVRERVADIRDVRLAFDGAFLHEERSRARLPLIAATVAVAIIAGVVGWSLRPAETAIGAATARSVIRFELDVAAGRHLSGGRAT